MVEYPPGEPQEQCAICGEPFTQYGSTFAEGYANLVCVTCDKQAVTEQHEPPKHGNEYSDDDTVIDDDGETVTLRAPPDDGDNPVFIAGQKCWRRYRFGGWITRRDDHDCDSLTEFYKTHRDDLF
jgi:hypothetical protein